MNSSLYFHFSLHITKKIHKIHFHKSSWCVLQGKDSNLDGIYPLQLGLCVVHCVAPVYVHVVGNLKSPTGLESDMVPSDGW